jgi:6-phosphogluconate dehydrogenase
VAIDGGNSFWKDGVRRGATFRARGLHFLDVGTSGGVWGLSRGFSLMIGGEDAIIRRLDPIFRALVPGRASAAPTPGREGLDPRPEEGYVHCGPNGAGHYVKMVHNGIEYGMMEAMAEGLDLMAHANSAALPEEHRLTLNLTDITEAWRRGSVVSSWLCDLTAQALAMDPKLEGFSGRVGDSGEGRWTVQAAVETAVAAPVLSAALWARFGTRDDDHIGAKVLSAMRLGFGGHLEPKKT